MRLAALGAATGAALIAICSIGPVNAGESGDAARGAAFAARHCARCHAIGASGESPYSSAPPFRVILARSPIDYMTRLLEEGLSSDHRAFREMQDFMLSEPETADLAAYWRSLGVAPAAQ